MRVGGIIRLALALALASPAPGQGSAHRRAVPDGAEASPIYRISFKEGSPVPGIGAMPAIRLPLECASDGTVFISMVQALGTGSPSRNLSPYSPSLLLMSVSPSHEAHSFPLDQVPDLYDVQDIGDYASESKVIFLIRATPEDKQAKQEYTTPDGIKHEYIANAAEHHFYIVIFDRQGNYQKTVKYEGTLRLNRLGAFLSGMYLAYGYDEVDRAPKLAILKDDGTLLKFLQIPEGDAPSSVCMQEPVGKSPAACRIAAMQFVPHGHSILVVQNKTTFPLLEVNEAGAIRSIRPRLPEGVQINMLIPSDENVYARVNQVSGGSIYELNSQDGTVLRRFQMGNNESSAAVACVHDGKFLSFEHTEGKLVPLIGTPEPAAVPDQPKPNGTKSERSENRAVPER